MFNSAIKLKNVSKSYLQGGKDICVLNDINIDVREGELVSITGPSGSGKTTLLNIIALIDSLDTGKLNVFGEDLSNLTDNQKSIFRKNNFGFVYQSNNLFDDFSAIENVALPLILNGYKKSDAYNESENILNKSGIIIIHRHKNEKDIFPQNFKIIEEKKYGISKILFLSSLN